MCKKQEQILEHDHLKKCFISNLTRNDWDQIYDEFRERVCSPYIYIYRLTDSVILDNSYVYKMSNIDKYISN